MSEVRELSREEGADLFDATAREQLGITGAEFLARRDRGDYDGLTGDGHVAVNRVAMLIPFAREETTSKRCPARSPESDLPCVLTDTRHAHCRGHESALQDDIWRACWGTCDDDWLRWGEARPAWPESR